MIFGIRKRIKAIKFAFLSPNEVRAMSATKIITADTYDDDGFPIEMGLMDPRLGVVEPGLRCKTCGRKVDECPGHFGHIDLAMPVIHVGYVKEIKRLLKSTCRVCGRLLHKPIELPEPSEAGDDSSELGTDMGATIETEISTWAPPSRPRSTWASASSGRTNGRPPRSGYAPTAAPSRSR